MTEREDLDVTAVLKVCPQCGRSSRGVETCPHDGTPLEKPPEFVPEEKVQLPGPGDVIAEKYEILSLLGEGGMSVVYKARQKLVDRVVAVKLLNKEASGDERSMKRFVREAKAASSLNHPNIVTIYDFGFTPDGMAYLCMDYLQGKSLEQVIADESGLAPSRAVPIFIQCCTALGLAHDNELIHRDLKPSNIMLIDRKDEKDVAKIIDFGIVKAADENLSKISGARTKPGFKPDDEAAKSGALTRTGYIVGSPLYMSPEQLMGEPLDKRSDIYSLGCVMYETLCSCLPFDGDTIYSIMHKQISDAPVPMTERKEALKEFPDLEAIVLKCLEKEPSKRYQTMAELKTALIEFKKKRLMTGESTTAMEAIAKPVVSTSDKRKVFVLGGSLLAVAAAGLFFFMSQSPQAPPLGASNSAERDKWSSFMQQAKNSMASGHMAEAEKAAQQAVLAGKKLGELEQASAEVILSNAVYAMGDRQKALEYVEHALPLIEKGETKNSLDYCEALGTRADIFALLHRYAEAERDYKEAIGLIEKMGPGAQSRLSPLEKNLALFYTVKGRWEDAEKYFKRASDHVEKTDVHGASSVYADYGLFLEEQGKHQEAMESYQKSLKLLEANNGADSVAAARDTLHIGINLMRLGRNEEAEDMLRRSVRLYRKHAANSKPLANALRALSDVCCSTNSDAEARELAAEADAIDAATEAGGN